MSDVALTSGWGTLHYQPLNGIAHSHTDVTSSTPPLKFNKSPSFIADIQKYLSHLFICPWHLCSHIINSRLLRNSSPTLKSMETWEISLNLHVHTRATYCFISCDEVAHYYGVNERRGFPCMLLCRSSFFPRKTLNIQFLSRIINFKGHCLIKIHICILFDIGG